MEQYEVRLERIVKSYDLGLLTVEANSKEEAIQIATDKYLSDAPEALNIDWWESDYIETTLDTGTSSDWEVEKL